MPASRQQRHALKDQSPVPMQQDLHQKMRLTTKFSSDHVYRFFTNEVLQNICVQLFLFICLNRVKFEISLFKHCRI